MATKRLSTFLSSTDQEKDGDTALEEEIGIDRRKSRRISQLFGFSIEEGVIEGGDSILVSEEGGKRSRRFSQLFARTSTSDHISSCGDKPLEVQEEDGILTMVFKLFVRPTRQATKHKRTSSSHSFKPPLPKASVKKDRIKITINIRPFWRRTQDLAARNESDALSLTHSISLTPTVVRNSLLKKKEQRPNSACDSKFSTLSSAISFTSLPHELTSITASQCAILLHLTRKVSRSLQNQERLTANFSSNLAFLFARKERLIDANPRLSRDLRRVLLQMMRGLRELVGRSFLKKAAFLQRSLQLVHDLTDTLEHGPGYRMQEVNDSDATLVPFPNVNPNSEAGNRVSIAISEINASKLSLISLAPLEMQVDVNHFLHSLMVLREDIGVQKMLDEALRAGIVGPCEDLRFPASVNERIAMKRFIGFVDTCLASMSRRYMEEEKVVKALEALGMVLKGDGV